MRSLSLLAVVMIGLYAGDAHAKHARFAGPHPLAPSVGGGMCSIEVPHAHSYEPHDVDVLYVKERGSHVFVGDPTAFGDDSPRFAHYGHHPVYWGHADDWCWISGPHHHWHAPPATVVGFENRGGAFWFVGARPEWYPMRVKSYGHVDAYYTTAPIVRLSIDIAPPLGFFGFYVLGPWAPERVAWYEPHGKGPPPWAPAWGARGLKGGKHDRGGFGDGFGDARHNNGPHKGGSFAPSRGGKQGNVFGGGGGFAGGKAVSRKGGGKGGAKGRKR